MADIRSKLNMLYSLEQLSSGENAFKKLHSLAKLIVTAVYLVCVASLGKYDLTRLTHDGDGTDSMENDLKAGSSSNAFLYICGSEQSYF